MGTLYDSEVNEKKHNTLKRHLGHRVYVNYYGQDNEMTIECEDCDEILVNVFKSEEEID